MSVISRMSGGQKCGVVASLIFAAVMLIGFPGFLWGFAIVAAYIVPAILAFAAIVFVLCWLGNRFGERNVSLAMLSIMAVAASLFLLGFEVFCLRIAGKIISGQAVDKLGTVVPLGSATVIGVHASLLLIAVCIGRHFFYPNLEIKKKWQKLGATALLTVLALSLGTGLVTMGTVIGYRDHTAERRAFYQGEIKRYEGLIKTLDAKD